MVKVDVIIPAYNAARFLPAAIESVEAQTFSDWRILLVDDGSTDNTPEIVAPYRERLGDKLKYIRQANAGVAAARNTAIRNATAEFLALLDADDVWLPWRLEESLKVFEDSPLVGISYGMIRCIDQDGNLKDWQDHKQKNAEGWIASHIYTRKVHVATPTIMFRRKCIEVVGLFDETMRATEDRDMCLRIALKYEVRFVNRVLAHYRISPNQMTTNHKRMLAAQIRFVEKHRGAPGCGAWQRRIALGGIYQEQAAVLKARGQGWAALKSSLRALMFNPADLSAVKTAGSLLFGWSRRNTNEWPRTA